MVLLLLYGWNIGPPRKILDTRIKVYCRHEFLMLRDLLC
jgi:hypothetical protein